METIQINSIKPLQPVYAQPADIIYLSSDADNLCIYKDSLGNFEHTIHTHIPVGCLNNFYFFTDTFISRVMEDYSNNNYSTFENTLRLIYSSKRKNVIIPFYVKRLRNMSYKLYIKNIIETIHLSNLYFTLLFPPSEVFAKGYNVSEYLLSSIKNVYYF